MAKNNLTVNVPGQLNFQMDYTAHGFKADRGVDYYMGWVLAMLLIHHRRWRQEMEANLAAKCEHNKTPYVAAARPVTGIVIKNQHLVCGVEMGGRKVRSFDMIIPEEPGLHDMGFSIHQQTRVALPETVCRFWELVEIYWEHIGDIRPLDQPRRKPYRLTADHGSLRCEYRYSEDIE